MKVKNCNGKNQGTLECVMIKVGGSRVSNRYMERRDEIRVYVYLSQKACIFKEDYIMRKRKKYFR